MARTILVVDDSESLRTMVKSYLAQEGFRVVTAVNGREALFVARDEKPDLILLDIMMPELGGYDFMRIYSKEAETPIILLTARLEENDKVLGLELGADDYVTKPFSPRELTARVRAVLRRAEKQGTEPDILRAGNIELSPDNRTITVGGELVELTAFEFDLLAMLMASPGRVYSRLDLLQKLQGVAFEGYERNIDVHIRHLRVKIEPDAANPQYIQTVYGIGYRFTES
ncbi:MAG: response regulator transcription factor [Anaerolineales bacterium]|nr:response regulator transcription factor [Anaerolineales bacterium]MCB8937164.1 response regulator transcription factor [Ardenticatenaceae bacterium]